MSFRLSVFLLSCLFTLGLSAQKVKTVTGTYEYHLPKNQSVEDGERIALERAQLQAIADAFGTVVNQSNFTSVTNREGNSSTDFFSLGSSEVKGEWIETIGEPEYERKFDDEGGVLIRVTVKGRIREIIPSQVDFEAKVLCNGTDLKFERNDFHSGDDLYLYFKSPVNGYLNVYLLDEIAQTAYCLLPYRNSLEGAIAVKRDVPYIFFSKEEASSKASEVDEYVMTCSREMERNILYVVFSENKFAKSTLENSGHIQPGQMELNDFRKWMVNSKKRDKNMVSKEIELIIKR